MQLTIFNFQDDAPVRVVLRGDQPWFIARDVCEVLGINHHRDAIQRLDDDERGSVIVDTPGGEQHMAAVNESGLYALIFKSRKPEARRFRKWVTSEVLPAIRRTGRWAARSAGPRITRKLERRALEMFAAGMTIIQVARALGVSHASVSLMVHGKFQFAPGAGEDETTPELRQAVARRVAEREMERLAGRMCHSLGNQELARIVDRLGRRMLAAIERQAIAEGGEA